MSAYDEGYEAYLGGYDVSDNPYNSECAEFGLWDEGFQSAEVENVQSDYDDSMDGDHDSCMDSIGWGVDEDYGYYGDE